MYNLNVIKDAEAKKKQNKDYNASIEKCQLQSIQGAIVEALSKGTTLFNISSYEDLLCKPQNITLDDPNYRVIYTGYSPFSECNTYCFKLVKNKFYRTKVVFYRLLHILTLGIL